MIDLATAQTKFLTPSEPQSGSNGKAALFENNGNKSLVQTVGLMALQGMGAEQIAFILKKPVDLIQDMFQDQALIEMFAREIEARGRYTLKKLAAGMAVDVMLTLHKIVMNPEAKDSDRISAGKELLDRGFGKPTPAGKQQQDDDGGFVGDNPEEKLAKLEAEVASKLQDREKRLAATQNYERQKP